MYPQQSRCDVTTSQQIGTLSRSACDFSPESLWTLCQFINRIPIGAKKITLFKQHHPTFIKNYWKTVTHGANWAFWTFWNFAGGQLFPRIFNFCKVLQEKQTKVGEFLQQTCQPPGPRGLWKNVRNLRNVTNQVTNVTSVTNGNVISDLIRDIRDRRDGPNGPSRDSQARLMTGVLRRQVGS